MNKKNVISIAALILGGALVVTGAIKIGEKAVIELLTGETPSNTSSVFHDEDEYFDEEFEREWNATHELREGDWEYCIEEDKVILTHCFADTETVTIPEYINGHKITQFEDYWEDEETEKPFFTSPNVKHVIFPDTVKYAETCTFSESGVQTVTLGKNTKEVLIGDIDNDKYSAKSLTEFKVSDKNPYFKAVDGVLYSRDMKDLYAYPTGKSEEEFTVPDSVRRIHEYAFSYAVNLRHIRFNEGLTRIDTYAFLCVPKLKSIKLPKSLESLRYEAFSSCSNLEKVDFNGTDVTANCEILDYAFFDTKINDKVEHDLRYSTPGREFYWNDTFITYVGKLPETFKIRDGTRVIADSAFCEDGFFREFNADSLKTVILPDSVERIGSGAFSDCNNLENIKFGKNIRAVDAYALCNTKLWKKLKKESGELIYYDGVLFRDNLSYTVKSKKYPEKLPEKLVVQPGTKIIANYAFSLNDYGGKCPIKSVSLPDGLKTIGRHAFEECDSITTMNIPASVDFIGYNAFKNTDITFTVRKNSYAHKYLTEHGFKKINVI